jgi:predicted transcriptional regulator of viral defense system
LRALDAALAALAARQFGVVSRLQLLAAGFSDRAIRRRLEAKRLHRIYAGVYAVGHPRVCREGRWLAAVLACGEGAVLSHRSAAALWGIRDYDGRIEVTARHAHRRGSLLVARRSSLERDEITAHRGIPATTVERTLVDLSAVLEPHHSTGHCAKRNTSASSTSPNSSACWIDTRVSAGRATSAVRRPSGAIARPNPLGA